MKKAKQSNLARVRDICATCEGDGYLPEWEDGEDVDVASSIVCDECGGTGFADEDAGLKSANVSQGTDAARVVTENDKSSERLQRASGTLNKNGESK